MNDKLRQTLEKIKALSKQNSEFAHELQKIAKSSSPANSASIPNVVIDDISLIREALSIRSNKSISYDFVTHQRLRDQLIIDNLRMENARLDCKMNDIERYISFCVNAFYQVESIINYYFHITHSTIQKTISAVENATSNEKNSNYRYKSNNIEKNVGDITISHKINAFYNLVLPSEINKDKVFMGKLRGVRNDYSHRGIVESNVLASIDEKFKEFHKKYSFDQIRSSLIKLVNAIKSEIENPVTITDESYSVDGVVTSMFLSSCFVKYGENTPAQLPGKLFNKVKELKQGDKVTLTMLNSNIIDVKPISN